MTPAETAAFEQKARETLAAKERDDLKRRIRLRREVTREIDAEERGPIIFPEAVTLDALLAQPDEPTPWRISTVSRRRVASSCSAIQVRQNDTRHEPDPVAARRRSVSRKVCGRPCRRNDRPDRLRDGENQLKRWYREQQIGDSAGVVVFRCADRRRVSTLLIRRCAPCGLIISARWASSISSSTACGRSLMPWDWMNITTSARFSCRSMRCSSRQVSPMRSWSTTWVTRANDREAIAGCAIGRTSNGASCGRTMIRHRRVFHGVWSRRQT